MIRTGVIALILSTPAIAVAQSGGDCVRQGRSICVAGGSGVVLKVEGDVRRSRGVGFKTVKPGDDLTAGDRLLIRQGSALLGLAPSCEITASPQSMITFTQGDAGFCAHGLFTDGVTTLPNSGDQRQAPKAVTPLSPPTAPPPPLDLTRGGVVDRPQEFRR